jgi:hypothetical protein
MKVKLISYSKPHDIDSKQNIQENDVIKDSTFFSDTIRVIIKNSWFVRLFF